MKLYQSVGPNPRVVLFFLAEKGIELNREFVDIRAGDNRTPEWLARNPRGSMPVLELDDGRMISESTAICEYLEELYPHTPLIGATAEARAATRSALRYIDFGVVGPMTNGFRSAEGLPMFQDRMLCVPEAAAGNKSYAQDGLVRADRMLAEFATQRSAEPVPEEVQRGMALQLDARSRHDVVDRLGDITCPTLVAGGRYDGIAPPANDVPDPRATTGTFCPCKYCNAAETSAVVRGRIAANG